MSGRRHPALRALDGALGASPDPRASGGRQVDRRERMLADVVLGLSSSPRSLPSKYFYDEAGSRLFDEITELEEYYLTRTETGIMEAHASAMAAEVGPGTLLVELGSGSSAKTRFLLERLDTPVGYVPIDISGDYLAQVAQRLRQEHPSVPILPLVADFTEPFALPAPPTPPERTIVYFPGSTVGNFLPLQAVRLLSQLRAVAGRGGGVLVGFDRVKATRVLEAAYNDAKGVTARFNLNLLAHVNDALGADFDLDGFRHRARFNEEASRIEMYLVSLREQVVRLDGHVFRFEAGESILTEYSHKYTLDAFGDLASSAGLEAHRTWTDPRGLFSVQLLVPGRP